MRRLAHLNSGTPLRVWYEALGPSKLWYASARLRAYFRQTKRTGSSIRIFSISYYYHLCYGVFC